MEKKPKRRVCRHEETTQIIICRCCQQTLLMKHDLHNMRKKPMSPEMKRDYGK